jgi:inosine-uridine nucleoside N-ribohydrolase
MPKRFLIPALLLGGLLAASPAVFAQKGELASIIFDTDMGPDYDDVGAIALLHAFADSGKCRILATMASNRYEGIAAVLNVFNTYFKRPGIPIGVAGGKAPDIRDNQHWTDSILARYPHRIKRNADAQDAVTLYRVILSQQPDHSVTIVTVGFFSNLAGLLKVPGGTELVKRKVKLLVSMAGGFPGPFREFNVYTDAAASAMVARDWPTPILFSGFEIGEKIKCGLPLIHNTAIHHSPVKDVFRISIPQAAEDAQGRMSWDETAVLVAIAGPSPWYHVQHGTMSVDAKGGNTWKDAGDGRHAHLVAVVPPANVQKEIDRLIMHQPR